MERSFGRPASTIFERLSREPVAAASLGQVYRGRLRQELGGHEIAVKVQRPGVLRAVALDLYLMRRLAVILDKYVSHTPRDTNLPGGPQAKVMVLQIWLSILWLNCWI